MKKLLSKQYVLTLLGFILGMVGGFLYWKYVGCSTGTCPITASPVNSALWGGAMGGLFFNLFEPHAKRK